ncbi:MAG: hypothetical protein J1E38_02275 [Paramuribaculum sp.]|nr:hypothetical protein [Paramuribaculum sp.]
MRHNIIGISILSLAAAAVLTGCDTEWEPTAHYGYHMPPVYYNPRPIHPIYGPGPVISWSAPSKPMQKPSQPSVPDNRPGQPNQNTGRPPVTGGGQSQNVPSIPSKPIPPQNTQPSQGRPPMMSRH